MFLPGSTASYPSNIVPDNEADKKRWMQQWVDAICFHSYYCFNYGRDVLNFQYARGEVPSTEFDHIVNMFKKEGAMSKGGYKKVLPAKVRNFNKIAVILNRGTSTALTNGLRFTVRVSNQDAIEQKLDDLSDKAAEKLTRMARQGANVAQQVGVPIVKGDNIERDDIEQVRKMNYDSEALESEVVINKCLQWLLANQQMNYTYKFIHQCFYNYRVTRKMAVEVLIQNGNPDFISIQPQQLIYDLNWHSPFVHQGTVAGHWFYSTPQEIRSLCPNMSKEEFDEVDKRCRTFGAGYAPPIGEEWWYQAGQKATGGMAATPNKCIVFKIYWKGLQSKRAKVTPNPIDEDNPHVHFLNGERRPNEDKKEWKARVENDNYCDPDKGEYITEKETEVLFECTRIANCSYQNMREVPDQYIDPNAPSLRELPIIGVVDPNPCVTDLVVPTMNLMIQLYFTLERLAGQAEGKQIVVDKANIDQNEDFFYNRKAFNVIYIDSSKEGDAQLFSNQKGGGQIPTEIDSGMSTAVNDILRLITFLNQEMNAIIGSSDAAQGEIKSDQTGIATRNATQQAQLSMMPYFDIWYTWVGMVMQSLEKRIKSAWAGSEKAFMIAGAKGMEYFKLPDTEWHNNTHDIYMENSVRSDQAIQMMTQFAEKLLPISEDPMLALSIMKMTRSSSSAEAEEIFTKGVAAMNKVKAEAADQGNKKEVALAQAAQHLEDTKLQRTREELASNERIAEMKIASTESIEAAKITHKEDEQDIAHDQSVKAKIVDSILTNQNNQ